MTKICSHCNIEKSIEEFGKCSSNRDGLSNICKQCRRTICMQSYNRHKDTVRKNAKIYKNKIQQYINDYKSCGCAICGEKEIACLDLHHLRDKSFNISRAVNRNSLDTIKQELDKCIVLCANCHRKLHAGKIKYNNMELKIKRLTEDAILPIRAHKGDAGIDLTCTTITQEINECGQLIIVYHTGLAVEIPEGYVGLLFPRSSIANKSLALTNSVGVIDAGYRGEIMAKMRSTTDVVPAIYKPGERFAQFVIVAIPEIEITEAADLSETERGEGGYGSTNTTETQGPSEEKVETTNQDSVEPAEAA